jgi:hypothetical protein
MMSKTSPSSIRIFAALLIGAIVAFTTASPALANPCAANPCAANPCAANPCAANPCAANPCAANPCAANPCAANPCAANPCAANPCAANPCAANPCAAKAPQLSDAELTTAYKGVLAKLLTGYAKSGNPWVSKYSKWAMFNRAPYISETHGQRYVNNYANDIAKSEYAKFERAGKMPVGSVLAKDTFRVKTGGKVEPGPLNLMEKMPAGFNPESGDWRFTMILPNGKVYGATKGKNGARVNFCAECHGFAEPDFMFFIPEEHRIK